MKDLKYIQCYVYIILLLSTPEGTVLL
jgi:hypothetical protein